MREHRIVSYCDRHLFSSEEHVEATTAVYFATSSVEVDKYQARRVDLCEPCVAELAGFAELVEEHGVAIGTAPRPAAVARLPRANPSPAQVNDPGDCLLCGKRYAWLATHYGTAHGLTLESVRTEEGKYPCAVCGEVFDAGQGLAVHTGSAHQTRVPYMLAEIEAAKGRHPSRRKRAVKVAAG